MERIRRRKGEGKDGSFRRRKRGRDVSCLREGDGEGLAAIRAETSVPDECAVSHAAFRPRLFSLSLSFSLPLQ